MKLGKWDDYLAMREGIQRLNATYRDLLSNDFGAIAGLLFDVGSGRYAAPPRDGDDHARAAWEADLVRLRDDARSSKALALAEAGERSHTEIQAWLRDLGHSLGFEVWIAANDHSRLFDGVPLAVGCCRELPESVTSLDGIDAVRLIDVLWIDRVTLNVAAGFEVEHSTTIYSGILRLLDLAFSGPDQPVKGLYLVAPDDREEEVRAQLQRPVFRGVANLQMKFLPYGELSRHREAIARFGQGLGPVEAIARSLT